MEMNISEVRWWLNRLNETRSEEAKALREAAKK